jgi:hypothetical protein
MIFALDAKIGKAVYGAVPTPAINRGQTLKTDRLKELSRIVVRV